MDFDFDFTSKSEAKEVLSHIKSQSEIEALTFTDDLDELARVKKMLSGSFVLQQDYALERLPSIISQYGPSCVAELVDLSRGLYPRLDIEGKILLADSVKEMASKSLVPTATVEGLLLPLILGVLKEPEEDIHEIVDSYGAALESVVGVLGKAVVKDKIVPVSVSMARVESTPIERELSCVVAATVLPVLTRQEVQQFFFQRVLEMCQDPERSVRAQACRCLPRLKEMGKDVLEGKILREIFDLMDDEDSVVRESSLASLQAVLDALSDETKTGQVLPFLRRACTRLSMDPLDPLAVSFSRALGPLANKLHPLMGDEDYDALVKSFKILATFPYKDELRQNCAHNYCAVLQAVGQQRYAGALHDTLTALASDQDKTVRQKIAAQFHEILAILGKDRSAQFTRPLLESLIRDPQPAVREEILARLKDALACYAAGTEAQRTPVFASIIRALQEADRVAGAGWRTRHLILLALPAVYKWFQPDQVLEVLLPLATRCMGPAAPAVLRTAAADAAVSLLRTPKLKPQQRGDAMLRLARDYARGKSCHLRLCFVDMAVSFLRRFSSKFFREHIFELATEMLSDQVANVRLYALQLLPPMKQTIRLPVDLEFLDRLTQALRNLQADVDRDVAAGARDVQEQFKAVPIRMARGAERDTDDPSSFGARDRAKEEEEGQLAVGKDEAERLKSLAAEGSGKKDPTANTLLSKRSSGQDLLSQAAARGAAAAARLRGPGPSSGGGVYRLSAAEDISTGFDGGLGANGLGVSGAAAGTRPRGVASTAGLGGVSGTSAAASAAARRPTGSGSGIVSSSGSASNGRMPSGSAAGPAASPIAVKNATAAAAQRGSPVATPRDGPSPRNGVGSPAVVAGRPGVSPVPQKRQSINASSDAPPRPPAISSSGIRGSSETGGLRFPPIHGTSSSNLTAVKSKQVQSIAAGTGLAAAGRVAASSSPAPKPTAGIAARKR